MLQVFLYSFLSAVLIPLIFLIENKTKEDESKSSIYYMKLFLTTFVINLIAFFVWNHLNGDNNIMNFPLDIEMP